MFEDEDDDADDEEEEDEEAGWLAVNEKKEIYNL